MQGKKGLNPVSYLLFEILTHTQSRCTHYDTPDNLLSRVDMGANPVDEPVSSALNMLNLSAPSPLPGLRDSALGHRFDDFLSPYDPQPSTSQFQNPSETDRRPSLQVPALQSSPEVNELDFSTSPSRGSDTRAAGEGASTSSGRSKSPPYHEEKRERKTQDDRKDPPGKSRGSQSKSSKKPKVSKSNDKKPDTSRGSGSGGGTKREDRKGDDDNQGGGRRRKEKA